MSSALHSPPTVRPSKLSVTDTSSQGLMEVLHDIDVHIGPSLRTQTGLIPYGRTKHKQSHDPAASVRT